MSTIAFHIVFRLADGRVVCRTPSQLRRVARSFVERDPGFRLTTFRVVGDHLHALVAVDDERAAAEFARRVEISIQNSLRPGVGFAPAHLTPVLTQRHLRHAFRYILGQEGHHGVELDPLHDGSNLPDLLGMRTIGLSTVGNVRSLLPRIGRADLVRELPSPEVLEEERTIGLLDLPYLADAAAAAFGLPNIRGSKPEALIARIAAVNIGRRVASAALVARALGISAATVRRLSKLEVSDEVIDAVEAQTRVRAAAGIGAANMSGGAHGAPKRARVGPP